ncbi:hypothetical protein H0E87_027055 [Populus deltoides]|uniref:Transmembrane protein n=1 Tax=Populus deltoides TaxID=3696 RepID=A0A8T2WZ87_POPDE|nr:hypothetical protein H0E87_027055 [Populus deltoides]
MGCVVAVMADGFNGVGVLSLFWAMVMSVVVFGQGGYGLWSSAWWLRLAGDVVADGRRLSGWFLGWLIWRLLLVVVAGRWLMVVRQWLCVVASGRVLAGVVIGLLVVGSVKGRLVVAGWCGEED